MLKYCTVSLGIMVQYLLKLSTDLGRWCACNRALSFVLFCFPLQGIKDMITQILLSGLQASSFDKNKKGNIGRQMRCFKVLLSIQVILAIVESASSLPFTSFLDFVYSDLLLKKLSDS